MVATIVCEIRRPEYRWYHTDFRISDYPIKFFVHGLAHFNEKDLPDIGEKGAALVRRAFEINGVDTIFISPYQLSVEISLAVPWAGVEEALVELMKSVFGFDKIVVVEMNQAPAVIGKPASKGGFWDPVKSIFNRRQEPLPMQAEEIPSDVEIAEEDSSDVDLPVEVLPAASIAGEDISAMDAEEGLAATDEPAGS